MIKRAAVFLLAAFPLLAQAPVPLEYGVKAAFLFNFTKFVDWPRSAFPSGSAPLKICIYGRDPFGIVLEQTIAREMPEGRNRIVERPQTIDQLRLCHVAFISDDNAVRLKSVLDALKDAQILTVGESPDFLEFGGIVNFTIDRNRVRFAVNLNRAHQVSLKISSKLLRLATSTEAGGLH